MVHRKQRDGARVISWNDADVEAVSALPKEIGDRIQAFSLAVQAFMADYGAGETPRLLQQTRSALDAAIVAEIGKPADIDSNIEGLREEYRRTKDRFDTLRTLTKEYLETEKCMHRGCETYATRSTQYGTPLCGQHAREHGTVTFERESAALLRALMAAIEE